MTILILIANTEYATKEEFQKSVLFGTELDKDTYYRIGGLFNYNFIIFLFSPINVFAISYSITCYQLKIILRNFINCILNGLFLNLDDLGKKYSDIVSTVLDIDNDLSFLQFLSVSVYAYIVYFALSGILHPTEFTFPGQTVIIFFNAFYQITSFIITTVSASFVSEEAANVRAAIRKLQSKNIISSAQKKHISSVVEENIYLTVWKIVPISRSFILGTIGAILTYVLLIDNLQLKS